MRKSDKNKVYNLSELTSEELQEVYKIVFEPTRRYKSLEFSDGSWGFNNSKEKNRTNAKELFYTLENIQVDCSNETKKRIKEMADIFEKYGYKIWDNKNALKKDSNLFLDVGMGNEVYLNFKKEDKTTISYEKFMELFGNKEKSQEFNNLVEVLNEELTEEAYKENPFIEEFDKIEIENYNELKRREKEKIILEFNPQSEHKLFKAYKETDNKLNYELDFNFITQLAERMAQNKHKYEPYNWQKLDNIAELKQALFRHVLEVMNGNYEDDGRMFAHLESIALNAMFINYQLKKTQ